MKQSALHILIKTFPVGSEAFRKFLTLVGEWWRETGEGTKPTGSPNIESDSDDEEYCNARFKRDLKRWGCPIRLLPAVRKFRIELGKEDKLFTAFGSKRREAGKLKFDVYSPNLHVNRYIWHQADRLHAAQQLGDNEQYWMIAKALLRSKGYQICALNHVLSGWHTHYAYFFVKRVLREVDRLSRAPLTYAQLGRIYIPKASGSWRPLGVPSHPWRIYSHMWQNLLTMYLTPYISSNQHGFMPGRGVLTAWKEIMERAVHAKFIAEYDLEKFFDKIRLSYIRSCLIYVGVPPAIAQEIHRINQSVTLLQEIDQIPESERDLFYQSDMSRNPNLPKNVKTPADKLKKDPRYNWSEDAINLAAETQADPGLFKTGTGREKKDFGVPQGLSTSPILSIFALSMAMTSLDKTSIIAYADDFIRFGWTRDHVMPWNPLPFPECCRWTWDSSSGNWHVRGLDADRDPPKAKFLRHLYPNWRLHGIAGNPTHDKYNLPIISHTEDMFWGWGKTPPEMHMEAAEIKINWRKSRAIKIAGAWVAPLKFLGMEYDGRKQTFRASTRRGAKLEFDSLHSVLAYMHAKRDNLMDNLTFPATTKPGSATTWGELSGMSDTFKNAGGQATIKLMQDWIKEDPRPASTEAWLDLPKSLRMVIQEGTIRWPWERLFKSRAYGFFMSRMQSDDWVSTIEQDFNYQFTSKSWGAVRGEDFGDYWKLDRINVFNSSSFAPMCLLMDLDYRRTLIRKVWSNTPVRSPTTRSRKKRRSSGT